MRLSVAALFLASSNQGVNAFSSFAVGNSNGGASRAGWDPSPFQENPEQPKPTKTAAGSDKPPFPSAPTNVNDFSSSINPVPFAATKADEADFNPLVRPIAFTKEAADDAVPHETESESNDDDTFAAKVSPPNFKQSVDTDSINSSSSSTAPAAVAFTTLKSEATTAETAQTPAVEKETEESTISSASTGGPSNNRGDDKEYVQGDDSTVTERMLKKSGGDAQAGGAGGQSTLEAFKRAEANWAKLKAFKPFTYDKKLLRWTQDGHGPPPQFVATDGAFGSPKAWEKLRNSAGKELDYDVVVCGGTLGIFFAMYLQLQGHNVCVVEAGKLRGREQEW